MLIQREKQRRLTTRCTHLRVCDQVCTTKKTLICTPYIHCDDCLIHAIPTSYVLCGVHIGIVKVVAVT